MIGIDVVGGLQKIVADWVIADDELREATERADRAKADCERARSKKEHAAKTLMGRVGPNIPTKVFRMGADVVIVEHERGIRRVAVEQPDAR